MAELGGPQISALLESVPGIANVLRSPVADALVNMIRAGARVGEYRPEDALELVQYATRRGLIGGDEGDRVLGEVKGIGARRVAVAVVGKKRTVRAPKATRGAAAKPRKAAARKAKPRKATVRRPKRKR